MGFNKMTLKKIWMAMGDFVIPENISTTVKHLLKGKVILASEGSLVSANKSATNG
jgi:hypothetical protein